MVCFLCLLTNYRRNNPQCCWESIFLPICQSVNIDNCEVINTPPIPRCIIFMWGRNEILFPQTPGREVMCHISLFGVSSADCGFGGTVCLRITRRRSTRRCCSSFISWTMLHFLNSLFWTDFQKFTWMLQKEKAPIAVDDTSARSSRLLCFFPVSQSQRIKMTVSP